MTDQEIERIRTFLGSEYSVTKVDGSVVVDKVNIWEGVEFAECDSDAFDRYTVGKIYPILNIDGEWVMTKYDDKLSHSNGLRKDEMNPSTEAAYVEKLKAKAKELYGEIKDGDRFDITYLGYKGIGHRSVSIATDEKGVWRYDKNTDQLSLDSFPLYKQGKWAKKIGEPISVYVSSIRYLREPIEYMGELIPSDTVDCTVHFTIEGFSPKIILKDDFRNLLSKCLEDYLNKSQ